MIGNWIFIVGIGGWLLLVFGAVFRDFIQNGIGYKTRGYSGGSPNVGDLYRKLMITFFFAGLFGLVLGVIGV